jgi:hypothetical protein
VGHPTDERGRRAPTPSALSSLAPVPDGFRVLPDPLHGQPLMRIPARPADVRVLLDRSYESAQSGEPTQDYLAIRCEPRRLTFAVTDGVGSSFLGDVAAQILAIHLADRFASAPADEVGQWLAQDLHALSTEVAERVANWHIPDSVSALMRAALDQQRSYGSEAMFVAGSIDLSGRRDAVATISWLGDTRLRVIMRDGQLFDHSGHTNDRWSTRLGPRGTIYSLSWRVAEVARIIACTDGVIPVLDGVADLPDAQLHDLARQQARRPGNDDMAMVDIGLAPRAMPAGVGLGSPAWREPQRRHARTTGTGAVLRRLIRAVGPSGSPDPTPVETGSSPDAPPPVPAPAPPVLVQSSVEDPASSGVEAPGPIGWRRTERGRRELNWLAVPGADSYGLQLCREKRFGDPLDYSVAGLTFLLPPMGSPIFGRFRSVAGGVPGPWSPVYDLSERPDAGGES